MTIKYLRVTQSNQAKMTQSINDTRIKNKKQAENDINSIITKNRRASIN